MVVSGFSLLGGVEGKYIAVINNLNPARALSVTSDDDFVYVGDYISPGGFIRKHDKKTLDVISESSNSNNNLLPTALSMDDNYIYSASKNTGYLFKHDKDDLSVVGNAYISSNLEYIDVDSDFIYMASSSMGGTIFKFSKDTLKRVAIVNVTSSESIRGMSIDDEFIYIAGYSGRISKYNKSDLSLVASSDVLNNKGIDAMDMFGEYLYINSQIFPTSRLARVNKSDLSLSLESSPITRPSDISCNSNGVFYTRDRTVHWCSFSDLEAIVKSLDIENPGNYKIFFSDDDYIYFGRENESNSYQALLIGGN